MEPSPTELGCFIISKTINFEPGENSLYIAAVNNAGSSKSEKIFFTVPDNLQIVTTKTDLPKPPAIAWDTPSGKNTALKSSSTNIKASIKTPFRLTSVVLYLNGVSQGEMEIKSLQNEPNSYTIEKTINFKQVENNIYLVAISLAGNTTSESRSFICPPSSLQKDQLTSQTAPKTSNEVVNNQPAKQVANQPISASPETRNEVVAIPPAKSVTAQPLSAAPVITWTSPSSPHTTLDTYNGTVKAKIKSNSGIKSVLLYLNGISKGEADIQPLPAEPGTYLLEKNINFSPGENSIYLVATNNEGSNKSDERYFSNPAAIPPVITWSNPNTPNSLANTESLVISACINSPTELKSVKLLVNGNILTEDNVFQAAASGDCNINWQSTVILREGDNSIFIIAANVAGSTTSVKRSIKFQPAIAEKRLALIIGNSDYKNSATLKNPVNDANLMEGTLKDIGFEVIKHLNAGKDEMMSAIREFENKIANYNVALFYYAGHGNQVDGKNYLIPIDAKLEKPTDCRFEAVEVDLIVEEFERYQDNTNIVILDACRNNPFASWARGGEAGFKMMSFTSGTIVAFATSEGTTAADGKGANGLYTEELVKQILIPQSISSVFMNTRVQVRKLSGNTQVPLEVNKLNGDFFFRK
ncbi:MAG: caspase family protein, partial [Bacteroidia bacterium]|nr:caspase family protein [Bacteroidia bacterium]